jgi:uncharacterized membrane protein
MTRQILAGLAAFAVLTFGGVAGAMAQQSTPAKLVQNPCAAKSQPAQTQSEKAWEDALRATGAGKTASELAKEIATRPSL